MRERKNVPAAIWRQERFYSVLGSIGPANDGAVGHHFHMLGPKTFGQFLIPVPDRLIDGHMALVDLAKRIAKILYPL